jgi:hypothetical protein
MLRKPGLQPKNYRVTEASADVSSVVTILNYFHPVSESIVRFLKERAYLVFLIKGTLLEEGQVCEHIYFIRKGR